MIRLGYTDDEKRACVAEFRRDHGIRKTVMLSPSRFVFACPDAEIIEWEQIIQYKFFYRLLQEIDGSTLIVVNECLRTQNRHDLTYNCIRHFLGQTTHQIIFQYLPLIDTVEDFMILFDFDTRSKWKRETFNPPLLAESDIAGVQMTPILRAIHINADVKTRAKYAAEKRRLIDGIGLKDPHTIPRNLLLVAGKTKARAVDPERWYIGRNNRLGVGRMLSYREDAYPEPSTVFEFCHNFIDFAGWLALSRQTKVEALVTDLKVDRWYFERYQKWGERIADAYTAIHI